MFSWWPVSRKDYTELEASYQAALAREKVNAARLIEKGGVPLTEDGEKSEEVFVTIPPDRCARFWELVDAEKSAGRDIYRQARYALWAYIAELFPETMEGKWELQGENQIWHPKIVKVGP